jgi:purine-binding chemotaxis protein CheW
METEVGVNEFVTFLISDEAFALNMAPVQEIIRVPQVVKVPKSSPSLIGLANLRGNVLPVINLRTIFGITEKELDESSRVIVVNFGQIIGFLVDKVASVINVDESKIEEISSDIKSVVKSKFLKGVIKNIAGFDMVMIFDIEKVIEREFSIISSEESRQYIESKVNESEDESYTEERRFVSFMLAEEEYAIPIENIKEIVQIPEHITKIPNTEKSIIGMMNLRDKILPLANLRSLFHIPEKELSEQSRIMVLSVGNLFVGVAVDSVREVLRVQESLIEPIPSILVENETNSEIKEVCRLDNGRRLVSIISVENLFKRKDIKEALDISNDENAIEEKLGTEEEIEDEEQFVLFELDHQEYAVPISSVQEIVRIPEELTRVPKTPEFVEGVINLRGNVLPVIDLCKRLDVKKKKRDEQQRIMVFIIEDIAIGFIVDSVKEVLKIPSKFIQKTPELSSEQTKLFKYVANLEKDGRMIQIIEPQELLKKDEIEKLEKPEVEE